MEIFIQTALVAFFSDGVFYAYEIEMAILGPSSELPGVSAILGRDMIDRWRITYDKSSSILQAEVNTADRTLQY